MQLGALVPVSFCHRCYHDLGRSTALPPDPSWSARATSALDPSPSALGIADRSRCLRSFLPPATNAGERCCRSTKEVFSDGGEGYLTSG